MECVLWIMDDRQTNEQRPDQQMMARPFEFLVQWTLLGVVLREEEVSPLEVPTTSLVGQQLIHSHWHLSHCYSLIHVMVWQGRVMEVCTGLWT